MSAGEGTRRLRRAAARLPLPASWRLPGTLALPRPLPPVRVPGTSARRRRSVLRRAAGLVVPAVLAGASYLVVVHRPVGARVVGDMSHREAWPGSGGVRVVGRTVRRDDGPAETGPPAAQAAQAGLAPVVLVHGLGMSGRSYQQMTRRLGERTWALAPDLPGYGRSPRPRRGALDVEELADAVAAWMRARGVGPAVLVGHSIGAQVVGEVALRSPELVRRLVVVSPTGDPQSPGRLALAGRLLRDGPRERPRIVLVAVLDYLRAGPGQALVLLGRALRRARQEIDERLPVPLLVVHAERDTVVRRRWCEQLAAMVPDGRLVVVEGHAHGLVFDAPPELVDLVLQEAQTAASSSAASWSGVWSSAASSSSA
ncbi:alpha/beta fold hydrolase [Pseudokineococcus sp. 1T1Z-3]|uniref:alpha/beta fold hydrolase n=1 Tax=Pseudokineococcus sp. 1T1Z-3 TaxID=3132745 RepID=UPI0030B2AF1C